MEDKGFKFRVLTSRPCDLMCDNLIFFQKIDKKNQAPPKISGV